ncbi:MAG: hypothetical protein Q8942_01940 [Bacillota bacterium]|nr:hypothetical protein [Bacillota bacterium]
MNHLIKSLFLIPIPPGRHNKKIVIGTKSTPPETPSKIDIFTSADMTNNNAVAPNNIIKIIIDLPITAPLLEGENNLDNRMAHIPNLIKLNIPPTNRPKKTSNLFLKNIKSIIANNINTTADLLTIYFSYLVFSNFFILIRIN